MSAFPRVPRGRKKTGELLEDTLTLYKLIVLYMLSRVTFPMTNAQVSDFILEKEYTDYLTLQQVISELTNAKLVSSKTIRNRTQLAITPEGRETLDFFQSRIHYAIKEEINAYFRENEFTPRNEVAVLGDYSYQASLGEYETHLVVREKGVSLVDVKIPVPTEEMAEKICDNWQKKSQQIYKYLTEQLF